MGLVWLAANMQHATTAIARRALASSNVPGRWTATATAFCIHRPEKTLSRREPPRCGCGLSNVSTADEERGKRPDRSRLFDNTADENDKFVTAGPARRK
jgi:hypothetical protein